MGKRARKTRWRALDIADDHSDSEESNTNSSAVSSRYSHSNSNGYYSKYSYSSQSTPARKRYNQYDGSTKSTRSSSTTSENKITFNEDEYTRITTPRQDVLFKKGYLNKPKSYQTQTSTGNSTISTGNSTENGTPDHQSADLDYESQFVFPNGFVDQNGIYYVNSYEPYPLMLFNPPTYYHEFSNNKSKRYSTGSLSESMSPNNEEATSQDLSQSGGEASNSGVSDYSGGPPVFNMIFPGYYVNDACTPTDVANDHHCPSEPVKKLKKRRERKSSKTIPGDSSEYTDDNSEDECSENTPLHRVAIAEQNSQGASPRVDAPSQRNGLENAEIRIVCDETKTASDNSTNANVDRSISNGCSDTKTELNEETSVSLAAQPNPDSPKTSVLKPDAEEFVPRAYQALGPPPHIKMIPPNFMPIPLMPIGEFGAQNFAPHPAFIPPGIPINFIPHHLGQKLYPPAPGFVNYPPLVVSEMKIEEQPDLDDESIVAEEKEKESTATPSHTPVVEENKPQTHSKTIDIATVVSKLEAVKQQENQSPPEDTSKAIVNESKPFKATPRLVKPPQTPKRNYYNKYRNSPVVRSGEASPQISNGDFRQSPARTVEVTNGNSPVQHRVEASQINQKPCSTSDVEAPPVHALSVDIRSSSERYQKRNWKSYGYQNNYGSPKRAPQMNHKHMNVTKHCSESVKNVAEPTPKISSPFANPAECLEQTKPKSNNQWIPVASRKKKKNKNVEDLDADAPNEPTDGSSDLFESYDVSQLVDVVPPSQLEAEVKRIEDILISIAQIETTTEEVASTNIIIPEVSDIEKEIVVKMEEASQPPVDASKEEVNVESSVAKEDSVAELASNEPTEEPYKPKKKSKKGTQKPLTKKVIITDIFNDLSVEPKTPLKKVIKKIEEIKPVITEPPTPIVAVKPELLEKKTKKKKKNKAVKSVASAAPDESYDVHLQTSLAGESLVKTNDEISLELDKLIQKGMYNSLQEKIKSINVESETDDFFKTIESVVSKDKPAATLKAPDFNRIFQSTRQFLKPNMVSVEPDIKVDIDDKGIKSCSSAADAANPSAGLVVDNASVDPETPEEADKKLYPITQAVKEWMSKTREATPEVEILKSPSAIQIEFRDVRIGENHGLNESDSEDEEVTLFSSAEALEQPDLLEYWENDLAVVSKDCDHSKNINVSDAKKICADGERCDKCRTDSIIKQGEVDIEVYESKYGQNEAYLHLQNEMRDKQRSGHLPYRAVCCSLQ